MFSVSKGCRISDLVPGHLVAGSNSAERPWEGVDAQIPTDSHGLPRIPGSPNSLQGEGFPLIQVVREMDCGESQESNDKHWKRIEAGSGGWASVLARPLDQNEVSEPQL